MAVKCNEAMAETASTLQAPESNQALGVDDSSAKTIEFLRARLLAERAASKAARQQAQQIAEKVKDLNDRLETEIENRKEAEAAMGKVFTILKAKGLAVDGFAVASTDLKDQVERGVSTLDDIKEMNKDPQEFHSCIMDPSIDKEVSPRPLENKDESTEKGMVEEREHSTSEPHTGDLENGIVSKVDETVETSCDDQDPSLCNVHNPDVVQAEIRENFLLQDAAEHHQYQVQLAVTDKPVVYTDNNSTPDFKDTHTSQNFDQGSSIALKLKAMLHQIEEEVAALPKEQPLKLELQGWVDHVAGVLDKEKEASLNGGLEMHTSDGSSKAGTNYPLKEATAFKTKSFTHTGRPILLTREESAVALNQIRDITEGQDIKEEMGKNLSIVRKEMLQQTNMAPPLNNYNGEIPYTMYPPTGKGPALPTKTFHNRRSSCDSLQFLQEPPKMSMHPKMMQYGISQTSVGHSPMFANGYTANGHYTGADAPYLVEAQSPRSSDVFSVGDGALQVGYGHGQWCEARSQGRGLDFERQAGRYREDALKRRCDTWSHGSREIHSRPYVVDVSNELRMKQDKYLDPRNIQIEREHAYPHRTYLHPIRDAAEFNMNCNPRHPKSLPLSDATLSLMDDRNGRLGDILMALDAARQHVNDEERSLYSEEQLFGPPTPTVEDARLNRGYHYGEDIQQAPYEYLNQTWRSRAHSQTPIIQFPPSPVSEHCYSPFERHGRHRRSSSVSTNFMISGWESYQQSRGEVQLGNGITLYTD